MQTIYLDISNKGVIPCIQAKQSEVGRKFLAVISDNGVPYNIPENVMLSVWYEGDTDAGNYSSIDNKSAFVIDGNNVEVELVAQMLLKPGRGEMCLSLTHGDGREINTWNIPYEVEYKPGATSTIPTEYYTALTEAGSVAATHATAAINAYLLAEETLAESVKSSELEALLLSYEERKTPVGYTFIWSPVEDSDVDLTTARKVAEYFGFGEWEQLQDRFLIGAGEKYPVGSTGGTETVTLTVDQVPSHEHTNLYVAGGSSAWGLNWGVAEDVLSGGAGAMFNELTTEGATQVATGKTGEGESHENMPPYLSVYIWRRIA